MTSISSACSRCSGLIEEGDRFCQDCGASLQHTPLRSPLLGRELETEQSVNVDVPSFLRQTDPNRTVTIIRRSPKMLEQGKSSRTWFSQPLTVPEWLLIVSMTVYSGTTIFFLQKDHPDWFGNLSPARLMSSLSIPKLNSAAPTAKIVAEKKPLDNAQASEVESLFNQSKVLAEKASSKVDGVAAKASDIAKEKTASASSPSTTAAGVIKRLVRTVPVEKVDNSQQRIGQQESEISTHLTGPGRLAVDQVMGRDRSRMDAASSKPAIVAPVFPTTPPVVAPPSAQPEAIDTISGVSPAKEKPKKLSKNDIDELAQYNKALTKFFSRQKEKPGDAPPGEGPPSDSEPPSFDEWLKSNKAEF